MLTAPSRASLRLAAALLVGGGVMGVSCRFYSRDVSCRRDRDCPVDAGMPYCTSWHADAGRCTDDDRYDGDFLPPPDGGDGSSPPDAGTADSGT